VSVAVAAPPIVAQSPALKEIVSVVERLASSQASVLIQGESGTGKDLFARLLHELGPRRGHPFLKLHCPSIPENLLESELFGHERGAFTDAKETKPGKLELAAGGTVELDHVEELPLAMQAKLLRVVEERRFERLGGTRTLGVDVRFVATAQGELRAAVAAGRFRDDLYHRLAVVPLTVPPLRERPEDILPLAEAVLRRLHDKGAPARRFAPAARELLRAYSWPGNVRELETAVERAALLAAAPEIAREHFPETLQDEPRTLWAAAPSLPTLKDLETSYIRHVLGRVNGRQQEAARVLGISRKALWEKKRRYGIV
jgi:DNA-binding NtrC family response regulator